MLDRIIVELGSWNWMVLGFVLLIFEIILPGFFLLWIGIAAILVGAMSLQLGGFAFWTWQVQVLVFLVLALVSAYVGKQVTSRTAESEEPLLNRRAEQLIGRTATLAEPIREGTGRIRLGDTFWRVSGPDLPVGARVRVTAVKEKDLELVVENIGPAA